MTTRRSVILWSLLIVLVILLALGLIGLYTPVVPTMVP